MDNSEPTSPRPVTPSNNSEGIIGIGITIAALGILCLLLGWAQWMREVHDVAMTFLILGAVMVLVGGVTAMMGQARKRR
ncbi:MAG: phage holin family protein [Verrucomicrobiota bacterium]|nr:phage holin family protein [Verrucomicrobiota bacterium]